MKHLLILLALVLCAGQAAAQSDSGKKAKEPSAAAGATRPRESNDAERLFRQLDRNGDGYLSPEELWNRRGQDDNWAAVDRDRDGRISPSEFMVLPRGQASAAGR